MKMFIKTMNPHIVCKDGTGLSVQVGENNYCTPRSNTGPYTTMEVGFGYTDNHPSATPPDSWRQYADDGTIFSSVFGYVPVELIQEYIDAHGGVDIAKTFKNALGVERDIK